MRTPSCTGTITPTGTSWPEARSRSTTLLAGAVEPLKTQAEVSIADIMRRRLTLTGSTLRARPVEFKTMVADEIGKTVWPYVEGGRLKPVIDRTFPLSDAAGAHARMEAGDHVGKIVLEIAP